MSVNKSSYNVGFGAVPYRIMGQSVKVNRKAKDLIRDLEKKGETVDTISKNLFNFRNKHCWKVASKSSKEIIILTGEDMPLASKLKKLSARAKMQKHKFKTKTMHENLLNTLEELKELGDHIMSKVQKTINV